LPIRDEGTTSARIQQSAHSLELRSHVLGSMA
jgi:hypothetical protein